MQLINTQSIRKFHCNASICRDDHLVLYHRVPRLFDALARADGRHARLLKTIARVKLLILDDWGLAATYSRFSTTATAAVQPLLPASST
jgi:DNA replication protein DnaC